MSYPRNQYISIPADDDLHNCLCILANNVKIKTYGITGALLDEAFTVVAFLALDDADSLDSPSFAVLPELRVARVDVVGVLSASVSTRLRCDILSVGMHICVGRHC